MQIYKLLTILQVFSMVNTRLLVPGLYPSRYEAKGDINLGVFVQVSTNPKLPGESHCSRLERGNANMLMMHIHFCEVSKFAMKEINERQDLLPNVTMGLVCVDTCDDPLTALARAVYFLEDHPQEGCAAADPSHGTDETQSLDSMELEHHKVVGVIGPFSSEEAVLVSTLLGVFQIPVLGTHSTSDELSDKKNFEYFVGLAPPDRFQANALVDIAMYFNWTYIGLIYSEDSYGEYGAKQVQMLVDRYNLCLAFAYKISITYVPQEEAEVLELLTTHSSLKAIIWFAEGAGLIRIFGAISREYPVPKMVYLFSYMSGYMRILYEDATVGSFTVGPVSASVPGFMDYMTGLVPGNNTQNPWLKLLWQETFDCDWEVETNNSCNDYRVGRSWYRYFYIISPYYDATYVYAHALHNVIGRNCPQAFSEASLLKDCIKGPDLLESIRNVSIEGISGTISFDKNGDRLGKYRISHMYQNPQDDVIAMTTAGYWDKLTETLDIFEEGVNMEFLRPTGLDSRSGHFKTLANGGELFIPYSVCSWPCGEKEFKIPQKVPCCWECRPCRDNEIVQNYTSCVECPKFHWPDENYADSCQEIPLTFLSWKEPVALSLGCFSLLGLFITTSFSTVLWKKKNTRLVKASNKGLSFLVLLGAFLAFGVVFCFLLKPSAETCILRQLGFHLTVNLLYSPIFVKSCRVYLIFTHGKKGLKKPILTSSLAQRVMVTFSICGQVCLVMTMMILSTPTTRLIMPVATKPYVELTCTQDLVRFLLPLSYNIIFILICAVLGYKSRRLPENFNESGFIFISVATTLFAWLVFLPTYFTAAKSHHQMAILGLCLLLNAYITILCLFGPKVYALYFVNEQKLSFDGLSATSASNKVAVSTVNATSNTFVHENSHLNEAQNQLTI